MSEWKTIESAPRDGTTILVCGGTLSWRGSYDCDAQMVEPDTANWMGGEWFIGNGESYGDRIICTPTHWMPLPSPPAMTSAAWDIPSFPTASPFR